MWQNILIIAVGGSLGAVLRFLVLDYFFRIIPGFPLGTLMVNFIGSFLMGLFLWHPHINEHPQIRYFMVVGMFGAFTTMSTFAADSLKLLEQEKFILFSLDVIGTIALCLLAVFFGKIVSGAIFH